MRSLLRSAAVCLLSAGACCAGAALAQGAAAPAQPPPSGYPGGDLPAARGGFFPQQPAYPSYPVAPAQLGYAPPGLAAHAGAPLWLPVDDVPQRLDNYLPAGGPLERLTGRPGAWYGVVFVPLTSRWPVQLWAWQRSRSHQLRVTALDAWPPWAVQVALPLPLRNDVTARGRPLVLTAPFVLPPASSADGVFLLIEQWSMVGDRPAPVWLQARVGYAPVVYDRGRGDAAWWASNDGAPGVARPLPGAPPGPLLAPRTDNGVIELPIVRLVTPMSRPAPQFDPWWER